MNTLTKNQCILYPSKELNPNGAIKPRRIKYERKKYDKEEYENQVGYSTKYLYIY